MSRHYKQWTPEQRNNGYTLTKTAIRLGIIILKKQCCRCGQDKGIIQLHCENYDFAIEGLPAMISGKTPNDAASQKQIAEAYEELCWRCHMMHHSEHINKKSCDRYWAEIKSGKMFPPVFKHDFGILARENGINKLAV